MTLKYIAHMNKRHLYSPKDPNFNMKHQLMLADPLPVITTNLK